MTGFVNEETDANSVEVGARVKTMKELFMERIGDIKVAMVLMCITVIGQGMMVTGALTVSVNMIERLFGYNSFQSGIIDTVYNVMFGASAFIVGYVGKRHKMFILGIGALIISIGCIVFIIPVFIFKYPTVSSTLPFLCNKNRVAKGNDCMLVSFSYLAIMCIAYAILGVGASPLYTVALTYIDERSHPSKSGIYTGLFYASASIGPAIAFGISMPILALPVTFGWNYGGYAALMSRENWVGAYWITYLIGSSILTVVSLLLMFFPERTNPNVHSTARQAELSSRVEYTFRNFILHSRKLMTNVPFMMINIGMFFEGVMSNAVATFFPKLIEAQFSIDSGTASLYSGILVVCGATSGLLLGGYLMTRFELHLKELIQKIAIMSVIGALFLSFLFIYCPSSQVIGVNSFRGEVTSFSQGCSSDCKCDLSLFYPVCLNGSKTLYSPCAAGCSIKLVVGSETTFRNCKCVDNSGDQMTTGSCRMVCNRLIWFMISGFIAMVVLFIIYVPLVKYTMRVVDANLNMFALGFQQIIVRLSFIVGPMIYGSLIDKSCILFQHVSSCAPTSNCLRYNLWSLTMFVGCTSIAFKLVSAAFHFSAFFYTPSGHTPLFLQSPISA